MTKGTKTGGRTKGTLNKRTMAKQEATQEAVLRVTQLIPEAHLFAGNALAMLASIYRDERQPMAARIEAAVEAMPYESPKLQAVPAMGGGAGSNPVRGEIVHSLTPESAAMVLKLIS